VFHSTKSIAFLVTGAAAAGLSALSLSAGCGGGSGGSGGSTTTTASHSGGSSSSGSSSSGSSTSGSSSGTGGSGTGGTTTTTSSATGLNKLNHIVVIYLENHSFDNLYGQFAGANGIANATSDAGTAHTYIQVDQTGAPYASLPQDLPYKGQPPFLPANQPNFPFSLDTVIPLNWAEPDAGFVGTDGGALQTPDVTHRYLHEIAQIDGNKMDKFALYNDNPSRGMTMGYYTTSKLPLAVEAGKYTLCDNFFHAAFGGSYMNHQWLVAAQTPKYEAAALPMSDGGVIPNFVSVSSSDQMTLTSSATTYAWAGDNILFPVTNGANTDYYTVNTCYSVNKPVPSFANPAQLIPEFTNKTIGDALIAANVTWAWYAGGWDNALAGSPDPLYQFHHQPFQYYHTFSDSTAAGMANKAKYLLDETKFLSAVTGGTLPSVSFIKPIGANNEHPSYADIIAGENHTISLINAIRTSNYWKDTAIIITYDEHGGYWDHVVPPTRDKWGPGIRVPTLVISPYAKGKHVDSTQYDTTAIIGLIKKRFNITDTIGAEAMGGDLTNAFDFTQTPLP
jgi:phospholipase C